MSTTTETVVRELDRRFDDGFDVRLLWNSRTNRVFVAIEDRRDGYAFEFRVDAANALEAFHHPFAFATNQYDLRSQPLERCFAIGAGESPPTARRRIHDAEPASARTCLDAVARFRRESASACGAAHETVCDSETGEDRRVGRGLGVALAPALSPRAESRHPECPRAGAAATGRCLRRRRSPTRTDRAAARDGRAPSAGISPPGRARGTAGREHPLRRSAAGSA